MKRWIFATIAAAVLAVAAGPALAQKKQLAIVVKGRDNPFFAAVGDGCARWNKDNAKSEYECVYTGPASALDEEGEIQIVDALITTGAAAIAISPSDPAKMATVLREKFPAMPIMTFEEDLLPEDRALRRTHLTTDQRLFGVRLAELLHQFRPAGGTLCIQSGADTAIDYAARAAALRETLAGAAVDRLSGQNGWTEVEGCPLAATDATMANTQLGEALTANPGIDTVVLTGGDAVAAPEAWTATTDPLLPRLKDTSLVILAANTSAAAMAALKAGRVQGLVGERPFEIGRTAPDIMLQLVGNADVPDPFYTGLDTCIAATIKDCLLK